MMKKIILLLLAVVSVGLLNAQDNEPEIETLFQKPSKIRGYIAPLTNTTTIDGEVAYMTGVNVAAIFNDHYVLGFYRVDLENNIFSNNDNYIGADINFDHKGIWLGYIFMPKNKLHFNINVQAGKGYIDLYDDVQNNWVDDDFIFVLTPSLEAEFNVAKFLRVGIGANYQFSMDVDHFTDYNNHDFSGPGAFISFRFGWFN